MEKTQNNSLPLKVLNLSADPADDLWGDVFERRQQRHFPLAHWNSAPDNRGKIHEPHKRL